MMATEIKILDNVQVVAHVENKASGLNMTTKKVETQTGMTIENIVKWNKYRKN